MCRLDVFKSFVICVDLQHFEFTRILAVRCAVLQSFGSLAYVSDIFRNFVT